MKEILNRYNSYYESITSGLLQHSFGMLIKERSYSSPAYRYGFNGKENDLETVTQDYGKRINDLRLCRFLSVDPLASSYPWYTPYQFAGNKPINSIDLDGLEEWAIICYKNNGQYTGLIILHIPRCYYTKLIEEEYEKEKSRIQNKISLEQNSGKKLTQANKKAIKEYEEDLKELANKRKLELDKIDKNYTKVIYEERQASGDELRKNENSKLQSDLDNFHPENVPGTELFTVDKLSESAKKILQVSIPDNVVPVANMEANCLPNGPTVSFVTNFQTNFNSDDATLSDQDKNSLRGVASVLEWLPNAHITITAFTDNTNTPEYNFALSQKRADACKVYLESLGIPSSSVTAIGGGPINTGNESSEGKKANRKATIGIN